MNGVQHKVDWHKHCIIHDIWGSHRADDEKSLCCVHWHKGGRDSAVGIVTCYGLDGPGIESRCEARFSASVQTSPGPYPASCAVGTGSFPGVKRPGRGADHPPRSKCWGHERVGLYLYSPSGPSWPVIGRTFTVYLYTDIKNQNAERA